MASKNARGPDKNPKTVFNPTTANRYLKHWGLGHEQLTRQPPAVRFQASQSNECWHFDLSPSDLKSVSNPLWHDPRKGTPQLMLYSLVDDRSGVAYVEYRCVYGEDVEAALRFCSMPCQPNLRTIPFRASGSALYRQRSGSVKAWCFKTS